MPNPQLYIIPSYLGENSPRNIFADVYLDVVKELRHYVVENEKSARKFLKFIYPEIPQQELEFEILDKRSNSLNMEDIVQFMEKNPKVGLLSEAGTPCIADPGNILVFWAQQKNWEIIPMVGPSSILLSLMASGLNGQHFEFHAYLPIDADQRKTAILQLEKESEKFNKTQIFMETPYRNMALFEALLKHLSPETQLCIASNVSLTSQQIKTRKVADWKKVKVDLHKKPSIFLINYNN